MALRKKLGALLGFLLAAAPWTHAAGGDYKLGAGDVLKIAVFDHPELAADVKVSDSGNITVPPVGTVPVAGSSTHEVEQLLAARLKQAEVLDSAQVTVNVTEYLSQRVAVMGQVAKPGEYSLVEQRTVMDVLAMAGGAMAMLAADEANLIHRDGTRAAIDLRRLFDGDLSANAVVQAGDTLFVPRAPQFYIYGEVQKPGAYRLERDMSLSQALAAAGGLTAKGTERGMAIKRVDGAGRERLYAIKQAGRLRPDDVVVVKEGWF